jgi:RNA polymerase subunit RPABC4/transcription elongation factor Spt4
MCDGCAPKFQQELASAHAHAKADAARQQLYEKAQKTDFVADVDMSVAAVARAPGPDAGAANKCTGCGTALGDGRFCPQCGAERHAMGCPGCGAIVPKGTHFCAQCGSKVG